MTSTIENLLFALASLAVLAAATSVAHAQDADDLRALCAQLEELQTPIVIDCYQAVADVESADSEDEAREILRRYFETDTPYDFQRTLVNAGEAGATAFDEP